MSQEVPIPASTVRTLAKSAVDEAKFERDEGREANARAIENAIQEVLSTDSDKNGEYVSLSSEHLSTLTAFGDRAASNVAKVYLKQYDIWN